jgi:O-methyltransferase
MNEPSRQVARELYIELTKKCLLDSLYGGDEYKPIRAGGKLFRLVNTYLAWRGMVPCKRSKIQDESRIEGKDWPARALSMIGVKRLENIQTCVEQLLKDNIPGDLIETGVWRGGSTILMKALLKVHDDNSRSVWVADSFEGLPKPNAELYPADAADQHHEFTELAVSQDIVAENFRRLGLLDDRVKFLKGWFKDTLASAPIEKLALLRLDGDMYESTMDALVALYPKLSLGGFVIIDDYGCVEGCRRAVQDYRKQHFIQELIIPIDWSGVFWRKGV